MQKIDVVSTGEHEYQVTVGDGGNATRHRVRVPQRVHSELDLPDVDEERLVRESFVFLLEREPAAAILREFELDVISRYFPEYGEELRSRLG